MTAAAGAAYTYNVQGLRIAKTIGNKAYHFQLVNGRILSINTYEYYLLGYEIVGNGSTYYLYNAHGDVIQLLNSNGEVTKTYDYDAYGNELTRDLNDSNPFRYCGEYYDTETGFIYLRARYYNPSVGRFISVDPAKDGLNWYSYCNNNPVVFVDRNGLWLETAWDIFSLGMSIYDVCKDPGDIWNWIGLAGDAIDVLVPCFGGLGETIKGASKTVGIVANAADDVADTAKAVGVAADAVDTAKDLIDAAKIPGTAKIIGGKLIDSYRSLKKYVKQIGIKGKEVHHLIEKRLSVVFGIVKNDIPSIILDKTTHKTITTAFRRKIAYATKNVAQKLHDLDPNEIWKAIVEVYTDLNMEDCIPALKEYLMKNAKNISEIKDWMGW